MRHSTGSLRSRNKLSRASLLARASSRMNIPKRDEIMKGCIIRSEEYLHLYIAWYRGRYSALGRGSWGRLLFFSIVYSN